MTIYMDAEARFRNELAENTRKTKESIAVISGKYNTNEQTVLLDTSTVILPANTYHSYSFVIFSGTVDITESGVTLSDAGVGYYGDSTATTLLSNSITFTGKQSGTKVIIKTLR